MILKLIVLIIMIMISFDERLTGFKETEDINYIKIIIDIVV